MKTCHKPKSKLLPNCLYLCDTILNLTITGEWWQPALHEGGNKNKKFVAGNEDEEEAEDNDLDNRCAGYVGEDETDDMEMKLVCKKGEKHVGDCQVIISSDRT